MFKQFIIIAALVIAATAGSRCTDNAAPTSAGALIVGSTTTTDDTGLLDALIPMFEDASGYDVTLVVGGSGQVIEQGARGDLDVLLTHSPAAEQNMVHDGNGIERRRVMYNDFIIVGPEADPAGVRAATTAAEAFAAIANTAERFVSRGDDSGTHVVERDIWASAGIEPFAESWYSESGQGQGATLQIANQARAYALTDRGTWLARSNDLELPLLLKGGDVFLNVYHVTIVNPERHTNVNVDGARAFSEFIRSAATQEFIRAFGVTEYGQALFTPNADPAE